MANINKLTPEEYQKKCIDNVIRAWKKRYPAIITAIGGAGKTIMSAIAAERIKADYVFVLAPLPTLNEWEKQLSTFLNKDKIMCVTYDTWKICKAHSYTIKKGKKDFTPSRVWNKLIKENKVVFILDEFHLLQNQSARTLAAAANVRAILNTECESRVIALSYTPCDDKLDIPNHMYLLNLAPLELVKYVQRTGKYSIKGLKDTVEKIESMGRKLNKEEKNKLNELDNKTGNRVKGLANVFASELFFKYVHPKIVFGCVPDFVKDEKVKPIYQNYFCRVSKKIENEIREVIEEHKHLPKNRQKSFCAVTATQEKLETIKYPLSIHMTKEWFKKYENGRVVILVNHISTMNLLKDKLSEYNPAIVYGKTKRNDRDIENNKFREHNNNCRVFIGTLKTSGSGINLNDDSLLGEYNTLLLMPPCYYAKDLAQGGCRVFRHGVTSKPTIRVVYTATSKGETDIEKKFYDSVQRKTNVIKLYHAKEQEQYNVLPCDYEEYITGRIII